MIFAIRFLWISGGKFGGVSVVEVGNGTAAQLPGRRIGLEGAHAGRRAPEKRWHASINFSCRSTSKTAG
jgi:hypothetical protein